MALELSAKNASVNIISPSQIKNTAISNSKENLPHYSIKFIEDVRLFGLGETLDVGNACVFLLSDASNGLQLQT